jgi:hypothetical protein
MDLEKSGDPHLAFEMWFAKPTNRNQRERPKEANPTTCAAGASCPDGQSAEWVNFVQE